MSSTTDSRLTTWAGRRWQARQQEGHTAHAGTSTKPVRLWSLKLSIRDGGVYQMPAGRGRRLGDLAGATAQMGSASAKHDLGMAAGALINPITVVLAPFLALRKRIRTAVFITFADGHVHTVPVTGDQRTVSAAEADVARFSAMAAQAAVEGGER